MKNSDLNKDTEEQETFNGRSKINKPRYGFHLDHQKMDGLNARVEIDDDLALVCSTRPYLPPLKHLEKYTRAISPLIPGYPGISRPAGYPPYNSG